MSIVSMAVVINLVSLIIRSTRVVHHHNKRTIKRTTNRFLVEFLRCIGLHLTHLFTALILVGVVERLNWFAKRKRQDVIDGT